MSGLLLLTDVRSSSYPYETNPLCILNGIQDALLLTKKTRKGAARVLLAIPSGFPYNELSSS